MKLLFSKPFYSVSIILLLAAGCGQKVPATQESKRTTTVSPTLPQPSSFPNRPASLWAAAGKKEALTQHETDSLKNVSQLRKKF